MESSKLQPPIQPRDHVLGPGEAPVTLVEYGDFQCPFCGEAYEIINRILEDMGPRLRFVFRHYPLAEEHPYAIQAAVAAEAAANQNRFWEMHDLLYEHQDALDTHDIRNYAELLDLDMERFEADLRDSRTYDQVQADLESGDRSGVEGTPTFYINGVKYEGPWDYESLLGALEVEASDMERAA